MPTSQTHLEEVPERERLLAKVSLLAIPLLLFATLLVVIAWMHPDTFQRAFGLIAVFMFTPVGKFTAGAFVASGFGVWETVFILGTVDFIVGLFLVLNFPFLYGLPKIGPFLARLELKGHALLQQQAWVRRAAVVGLALLVAIPFQGTGSIAGSIAGRMLGLGPKRTMLAIALGGYGGIAIVAGASFGIAGALRANLGLGVALLAAVVLGLAAVSLVYWRNQNRSTPADSM